MACTKEAMVIIMDVGPNTRGGDSDDRSLFDREKDFVMSLMQKKIFQRKLDEIGLIIMGSSTTANSLNIEHISEAVPLEIPNWSTYVMLNSSFRPENYTADWSDALMVALNMLETNKTRNFSNLTVVLLTSFDTQVNKENVENNVITKMKELNADLIVVSNAVEVSVEEVTGNVEGKFRKYIGNETYQRVNQELVMKIVHATTNGSLCNYDYAVEHLMTCQRKKGRTCFWNADLVLGKEVIPVSVAIAIKSENRFKFIQESKRENTMLRRDVEYFKSGEQITPDPADLIQAYMVGSEPIPYDKTLGITNEVLPRSLKCLAFTKKTKIPIGQYTGSSGYIALAKKGIRPAARQYFEILVKAMKRLNLTMIASRVYNKGNKPKLVALITKDCDDTSMTMIELSFGDNFKNWIFPSLDVKKTQVTDEQCEAVGNLMDSMDLSSLPKDKFPFKLYNPFEQTLHQVVGRKAIKADYYETNVDPAIMKLYKIPQSIKEKSAYDLEKVKKLFVLKENKTDTKKELIRNLASIPDQSGGPFITDSASASITSLNEVNEVGTVTPAEDFKYLVEKYQDERYLEIADQMANVLNNLILKSLTPQVEKITKAIQVYRTEGLFYCADDYNSWVKALKIALVERKMFEFWENIIVKPRFGILSLEESDLVNNITAEDAEEFYKVNQVVASSRDQADDDETAEDLFEMM